MSGVRVSLEYKLTDAVAQEVKEWRTFVAPTRRELRAGFASPANADALAFLHAEHGCPGAGGRGQNE